MTPGPRSLPLLIVCSLLAFLLGSVGTAVAGPALTEKAVKRIATKVVKKQTPRLTARNARQLAGRPPAAYLDRVAHSSTIADPTLPFNATVEVIAPISLTMPPGAGLVRVTGNASFSGSGFGSLWYAIDTSCADETAVGWERRVAFTPESTRGNATVDSVEPLAGAHVVRLCGRITGGSGSVANASLTVQSVAGDGTGA